ncbi:hypothetical protein [Lysobacter enzymogenes]|uniref:hypothetical protein n=1 Tax=Lysobacter enzymogenes TaxID=69 RepID=UPI0014419225|nr:hypothetical protein [Lysobacter enzymogenes]
MTRPLISVGDRSDHRGFGVGDGRGRNAGASALARREDMIVGTVRRIAARARAATTG